MKNKILNRLIVVLIYLIICNPLVSQTENINNNLNTNEEVRAEFGNWLQVCERNKNKCVAVQFALNVEGNRAARFVLERLNEGDINKVDSIITFFIPFSSNIPILQNGLTLLVDSNETFTEQFLFCDQLGCTSQFGLTKEGVKLFMNGANLTLSMVDVRTPNKKYIVDIDLENFKTIYTEILSPKS